MIRHKKFTNNELENCQRVLSVVNNTFDNKTILNLISEKFSDIFINIMKSFRDDDAFCQYFNQQYYLFDADCFIDKKMLKLIFQFLEVRYLI